MYTLITAANSAEAYKLKKTLGGETVLMGDYEELPAFMLSAASMLKLPDPKSTSYSHEMLTLCLDMQIENVYALRDTEKQLLAESRQLFEEYGIVLHF